MAADPFNDSGSPAAVTAPSVVDPTPAPTVAVAAVESQPSATGTEHFTVTFSKPVTGVDAGDFKAYGSLGSSSAARSTLVTGGGAIYTVTVTGLATGETVKLDVINSGRIADWFGNALYLPLPKAPGGCSCACSCRSGNKGVAPSGGAVQQTAPAVYSATGASGGGLACDSLSGCQTNSASGYGWVNTIIPKIVESLIGLTIDFSPTNVLSFIDPSGSYTPLYGTKATLDENPTTHVLTLTTEDGSVYTFNGLVVFQIEVDRFMIVCIKALFPCQVGEEPKYGQGSQVRCAVDDGGTGDVGIAGR